MTDGFTSQQIAKAIMPKITGTISAFFSGVIVYIVVRSQKRREQTFHRLMAALSVVDTCSSISFAMSTWPIPKGQGPIWAIGTRATCQAQAFFIHLAVASMIYNLSLSFYYVLVIRYCWKRDSIARIEPLMHAIPWLWAVGTGFAGYFMGAYDFANLWCWIRQPDQHLRWAFYYIPLAICYVVIFINCFLTWRHVHKVESSTVKFRFWTSNYSQSREMSVTAGAAPTDAAGKVRFESNWSGHEGRRQSILSMGRRASSARNLLSGGNSVAGGSVDELGNVRSPNERRRDFRKSRMMMRQCFLYAGGFYVTWTAMMSARLIQLFGVTLDPLFFIASICAPMQGLPNILVYLLPEFRRLRRKHPHSSVLRLIISVFFGFDHNDTESSTSPSANRFSSNRRRRSRKSENNSDDQMISMDSDRNIRVDMEPIGDAGSSEYGMHVSGDDEIADFHGDDDDDDGSLEDHELEDFKDVPIMRSNSLHAYDSAGYLTCGDESSEHPHHPQQQGGCAAAVDGPSKRSAEFEQQHQQRIFTRRNSHHGSIHGSDYLTCDENAEQSTIDSGFFTAWMERRVGSNWVEQSSLSSNEENTTPTTPSPPTTAETSVEFTTEAVVDMVSEKRGHDSTTTGSYL